jgi:MbtH protein
MTDIDQYFVVRNAEEQYSIWPAYREVPAGWDTIGEPRAKEDCLAYIETHWTDIRPKSLRERLATMAAPGELDDHQH